MPFRFVRGDLLAWDDTRIDPWRAVWMVNYVCDIHDRVPSFVWKQ